MYDNSNINTNSNNGWKALMFFCICGVILGSSNEALANSQYASSANAIGQSLCFFVQSLTGSIAKGVATVAIFSLAGGLLLGKLQWTTALVTAAGIIMVFSAGQVVGWMSGSSGISSGTNCSNSA